MKTLVLCFLCFAAGSGTLFADTNVTGTINTSQTWTLAGSPYIITGNVVVSGGSSPIITIEAGVQVRFNSAASIRLGDPNYSSESGGIVANGTAANPVLFTANSASPSPGYWNYIYTHPYTSTANSFTYAIFEYGGSGGIGMFTVNGGSPAFTNCTFRHSANYGIYHSGTGVSATVSSSSFQDNASYPMYWNPQFVSSIGTDNSFSGNGTQRILLRSNTLYSAETWSDKGIPLEMENDLNLKNYETTLIVQPGTQVLFRNGKRLNVGDGNYYNNAGSIQASGAIFGAVDPVAGWNGIYCYLYIQASLLNNCTIRDVNSTPYGAVTINCGSLFALQDCLFTNNNNYGLYSYNGGNFSLTGCIFTGNAKTVAVFAGDVQKLLAGNVYTGNSENRIHCLGGTISAAASWTAQSTPIKVSANVNFNTDGVQLLVMPSGVELQFDSGRYFYVGDPNYSSQLPQLQATGVTFKASDPVAGWMGIYFYTYSTPSTLDNCTIRDVAASSGGAVYINSNNQVTVQNCLFTNNSTYGLYCNTAGNFTLSGCTFTANAKTVGVFARDMHKLLAGNVYTGNVDDRVRCLGGLISTSATWTTQSIPILVTADIDLNTSGSHILTIPFGTVLEFAAAKYFNIGDPNYSSQHPSLQATGVTFRGAEQTPGYWYGLIFRYYGDPSLLSGCTVRDAGYGNVGAIRCYITNSTITGCTVENNLNLGIWMADNSMVAISGTTITTCGTYPLSIHVERLRALTGQNQFTGNTIDRVLVRAGYVVSSGTWHNHGVPYELSDHTYISSSSSPHISILPGTVIMLPNARGIFIGDPNFYTETGSLSAEGVTFTRNSVSSVPMGLVFYHYGTLGASHFTACVFEYLRYSTATGAVWVTNVDPVFENCIFRNNPGNGLYVTASGRASAVNCQFLDNGSYPISATASSFAYVSGSGNFFSGNTPNRILISGGTLVQGYVWNNPSVPVEVSTSIEMNSGSGQPILKINSGLVLLFRTNTGLYIGDPNYPSQSGGLQADGATFSALNGTAGGWNGITFYTYGRSDSYLSGCVVEYAGSTGNIRVQYAPLAYIDGCVIRNGNYGVYAVGPNSLPSISKSYIQNNGVGVYCTINANPMIGGSTGNANSFSGNTTYAVQNTTSSFNVNALYNWWGDPSGPYHASLNPGGLGDDVSNYVDFIPWRNTEIGDAPARFHLLSPANANVVETLNPVLDWEEAIDPTPGDTVAYTLLIARNTGFTSGLITVADLSSTVYHIPNGTLGDDTRYYWKVSATDTQDQMVWCYENYFYFDTAVPEAPLPFALDSPLDYATVHLTSNLLDWQATTDPDPGNTVTYTVYWDFSAGFENPGSLTTSNTSAWSGFCAPGSLIYWKVKAFDNTGRETFSTVRRFYVHPDAKPRPPVYFILTPIGSDMQVEWDAVPGADAYDIYFSTLPYTGFSLLQAGLASPLYLHLGMAAGTYGFYYVKAHDTQ